MCGICGEINRNTKSIDETSVKRMVKKLQHRGPDDMGVWSDTFSKGTILLGHTRLSILDLSSAGHQPMCDVSKNYWITFNGEIYNYKEIKHGLKKEGFVFKNNTDTEVIIAAYKKYGTDCLKKFNGMFSFALWDKKRETLFCARDRLGIKPFYFTKTDNRFVFASEIKAILQTDKIYAEPDMESIYDYLSLGLMHYSEKTFFKRIYSLPAGSFMLIHDSKFTRRYFWKLSQTNISYRSKIDIEKIQHLLDDSIRLRLRSDVPVGILLSGGLDSSTITALAAKHYESKLRAFSLEFNDSDSNEFEHAKKIASHCGASLDLLKPEGKGLWEEIDALIHAQDAPTHAPEVYSNWCMMRSVANCDVKVLLCGQGGDELFCGYNWYPKYFLVSLLKKMKLNTFFNELLSLPVNFPNSNTQKRYILVSLVLQAILPGNIKRRMKPELRSINQILVSSLRNEMCSRDMFNIGLLDPPTLEEKMYNDMTCATVPQYVHYEDSNAMAFGIEERVPMLDHNLVEWMHGLSIQWKLKNGTSKYCLREAMRSILPEEIVNRKDKMGLSAPRDLWFRNELRISIESLFNRDCRIYEKLINRSVFKSQLKEYMIGKSIPLSRILWRIINIEKWFNIYFN